MVLAATYIIILVAFVQLGSAMNTDWQVERYQDHIKVDNRKTAIASTKGPTTPEGTYKVRESQIQIELAPGHAIDAIVRQPVGAPGPRPACLFIHGAGTGKASEVYGDLASAMASAGITTLVPDKRLDTYSTLHRNYEAMSRDYDKSFEKLRSWPGVNPAMVGIYAESEGTWISSIMTARRHDVAYTILTSAPVYPGRQQMPMAATSYLDLIKAPSGIKKVIPKLLGMDFSSLGLEYADFESLPYLDHITQPTLVNYGTDDVSMPVEQGAREIMCRTRDAGNRNVTVRYYPTNHQIRTGSRLAKDGLPLESHYTHDLEDWINGVAEGTGADQWATPMIAGSSPNQLFAAPQETSPGLLHSLNTLLILMVGGPVLLLLALLSSCGTALASWVRKRKLQRNPEKARAGTIGYGSGIAVRLCGLGLGSLVVMGLLVWYALRVVRHALTLEPLSSASVAGWTGLRCLALVLSLVLASLITRAVIRVPSNSQEEGTEVLPHGIHLAAGWGHWLTLVLTVTGSIMILATLAFWGLFSF